MLRLSAAGWAVTLAPELGGAVLTASFAGQDVLRPAPQGVDDPRDAACYPLVPYANRIGRGRFRFAGVEHRLRLNDPPHALHGVGWRRPWRVESHDDRSAVLSLEHRPAGDDAADWPYAFDARQRIAVAAGGVSIRLSIRNAGDGPAPAGLGLHPFFPRPAGQSLQFNAAGAWLNGGDMLPSTRASGGAWDYARARPPADDLDTDLFGWDGRAALAGPDRTTLLVADPVFGHLRVFAPAGADFIAVEPVTHMADAINRPDAPDHGLCRLGPGETLQGSVGFAVAPKSARAPAPASLT